MALRNGSDNRSPEALVVVRNTVSHDARVLRTAALLRESGLEPLIVGVMSEELRRAEERIQDLPVLRLDPRSPMGRLRRRLAARRSTGGPDAQAAGAVASPSPATRLPGPVVALHRVLTTLDFYRQGIDVVRRTRPALVHCNDFNTMWIGVAARLMGSAVVYDTHELWADRNGRREPRWWVIAWEWLFVRAAHRTITTSPAYAEVLARRYRIDAPALVRNIPRRTGPPPSPAAAARPSEIAYVGGLMAGRGLEPAIAALGHAPDATIVAIGPGRPEYRRRLAQLALEHGVADRFELRDPVPPAEVGQAIAGAGAGLVLIEPVCLSYRLTLPNKLFEYLLAGLPVVASALPAIEDVVNQTGAGVLADPADPRSIARAFEEVAGRQAELRAAAREAAGRLSAEDELAELGRVHADALELAGER